MKRLIIIPAYNEEKSIEKVIQDIESHVNGFDYIIINDCSTDYTAEICRKNGFPVLNLPINLGIGGAVQTGYLYALKNDYDIVVQFDGDGQHDASYLEKMCEKLEKEKLDMVIGSRFLQREGFQSSGLRRMGIHYFAALIRFFTGQIITDPTSGMRMTGKAVIAYFARQYPKDYPEPESIVAILKLGFQAAEYPVKMREREEGVSSISATKSIYYMIKVTLAILLEMMRK